MSKASLRQAGAVLRLMDEAEWNSDLVQTFVGNWGSIRDLTVALHEGRLTLEQLNAVTEGRFEIVTPEAVAVTTTTVADMDYFVPLSDTDAVQSLVTRGRSQEFDEATVKAWRSLAKSLDYEGPVCWQIKAGFTLKYHAPKAGPCHKEFQYLQDWNFPDEPTKDCVVFFIPRFLKRSTEKNVNEQTALLADTRRRHKLPNHHLTSYGQIGLLAGLILAHFKATGERVPFKNYWIRTDTCGADGGRLDLGCFDGDGLRGGDWGWGDRHRDGALGCFPLGVES